MDDEPPNRIRVMNLHPSARAPRLLLQRAARSTFLRHGVCGAALNIVLVDDPAIARINRTHLKHRGPTDVITFDLTDEGDGLTGELVVSWDTAVREASVRGHAVCAELALYVVHGVLHLVGYDDASARQAKRMHQVEDEILSELGVGTVYASKPLSSAAPPRPTSRASRGGAAKRTGVRRVNAIGATA